MDPRFKRHIETLESKYHELVNSKVASINDLPKSGGIYLFSEDSKHLSVGRTRNIRNRVRRHINESSKDSPLAFKLAREATGKIKATYQTKGSRAKLLQDPIFSRAYSDAKRRIRSMNIRFVNENDPIRQTLLEVYVALTLDAPYNDFDTH